MQHLNFFKQTTFLASLFSLLLLTACQVNAVADLPTQEPEQIDESLIVETATATPSLETEVEGELETEATAEIMQATATPVQTFAPIIQQPAEDAPTGYWSYFSNPGGGGAFHTVGQGPDGLVIATSDLSGAYLNRAIQDPSSRWEIIGLNRGLSATHVSAVGFHPTDPELVFLGTDNGIFRSADGATTFTQVFADGYFHDILVIAPNDQPVTVYATYHPAWDSTEGEILKSIDGGLTWSIISQNLPSGLRLIKLLPAPNSPNMLIALSGEARFATGPAAAFRSADGGQTWSPIGVELGAIMDIEYDAAGQLWSTTFETEPDLYGTLFSSTDHGDAWQQVAQRHGVIWPASNGRLRLIDTRYQFPWDERNGVWESADGGASWAQISSVDNYDFGWSTAYFAHLSSFDGPISTLALSGDTAIWVNSQFVFGSFDGGRTFQNLYTDQTESGTFSSRGIDNIVFFDAAASAQATDGTSAMYMAMYDMGCFRSLDGGASWDNCNVPDYTGNWDGAGGNSFSVITDPTRAGTVWMTQAGDIGENVSLVRSDNFGAADSWRLSNSGLPISGSITGLAIDPNSPADSRTLFVAVDGDVYRSMDDGVSWALVFACGGCRFTAVDPHGSGQVLAGGEAGLFRSADAGSPDSWFAIGETGMTGTVQGDYWEWGWNGVRDIDFDPTTPGRIAVGVLGASGGVYLSENAGDSWTKVLDDPFVRDVHFTLRNLFVASSSAWESGGYDPAGQGVLRSDDGGQTWSAENDGLPWPFPAKFVTLNDEEETLLMAVQGPGFYVADFAR